MSKIVLPLSGGMDSAVLLFKAARECSEVHCIFYDYGQRHRKELICARTLFQKVKKLYTDVRFELQEVNVQFLRMLAPTSSLTNDDIETPNIRKMAGEAQPKSYVPFRNLLFLSIALSRAEAVGATEVWHGSTAVDSLAGYWDASPEFLPKLNEVADLNRDNRIKVKAPLQKLNKSDIVQLGVQLGVPFQDTYTCYSGNDLADATTPSSSLRIQGFIAAGYRDPQQYIQQESINAVYEKHNCRVIDQKL